MLGAEFWTFLSDFGLMWNAFIIFVNQVFSVIVNTPFLLLTIGIFFLGVCIKFFGEML